MREVFILPKLKAFPANSAPTLRKMPDEEWKKHIFHLLLEVYNNVDFIEINEILQYESLKPIREREKAIKHYFKKRFFLSKAFLNKDFILNWEPETETDIGFYDIEFMHSMWHHENRVKKHFVFECKNLEDNNYYYKEYIFNNNDGGVFRFVNGKYCSDMDFGGMIGFVLKGNIQKIRQNIIAQLKVIKINTTNNADYFEPEIIENTIFNLPNTFDSLHYRNILLPIKLHHILFDFSDNN